MAVRLYVEAVGCDDIHLFVGVRKFRGRIESKFEGSYGFASDMVTHGWQCAAFRELDERLSKPMQPVQTFRREERLQPREIVPVDVELRPQATRFRAGDRLRLEIRGTWFFPRNPFTGQFPAGYSPSPKGRFVIHAGGEHDSFLYVGVTHATPRE
jgi:predicted acyl esterase